MSRTPAFGHAGAGGAAGQKPAPGAPAKPVAAAPPAGPAAPAPLVTRRIALAAGAVVASLLVLALVLWKPWASPPPRLNSDPHIIAKFAAGGSFDDLPFPQQREYMDILDDKDDALLAAYKDGRLTDQQYRRALQLGWYDKQLDRMENYFERPPGQRNAYLDKFARPKKKGDGKKDDEEEESDDLSPLKAEEIDRDDSTEERDIQKWPSDVRQKWVEYRQALAARKQYWKDQEKAAEAAAAPTGSATPTNGG
jgi:hypothetical protein